MAASMRYVGARTPFGTITQVEDQLYNATATVQARDGSTRQYALPFLVAHGLELPDKHCHIDQEETCQLFSSGRRKPTIF